MVSDYLRWQWVACAVALAIVALSGCAREPDVDALREEIAATLEQEFKPGLFEIESIRRLGSASHRDPETGDRRKTVFFNLGLRFAEPADLSSWDGLTGESIAFLLGASDQGVDGIRAGGNEAGDLLRIHGSREYALRQGEWRAVPKTTRTAGSAQIANESRQLIERINELAEYSAQRHGGTEAEIVNKELSGSLQRIERALDQQAQIFSIASGPRDGAYYRYVRALEKNPRFLGFRVRNYPTQGSVENCQLVQSGGVELAIAQSNTTALALAGDGTFRSNGRLGDLRALAALFPEYLQIVVAADSGVESVADLVGKRVDLGLPASGTRIDALRLLEAADIKLPDFAAVGEAGLDSAVTALANGELDAFFATLQAPAGALQRLLAKGNARLVKIPVPLQAGILERYPFYRSAIVPAYTYPGQDEPIATLSVTATLIARADLPDDRIEQVLNGLFKSVAAVSQSTLRAVLLSPQTAQEGISIPLHPAAERYFAALDPPAEEG